MKPACSSSSRSRMVIMVHNLHWVTVNFVQFRACLEVGVFAAEELCPVYAENPVGDFRYDAYVVGGQDNSYPFLLVQAFEHTVELCLRSRVHSARRLIQQEQFRLG